MLQRTDVETLPQDDLFETSDFEGDHQETESEEKPEKQPTKVSNNGASTLPKQLRSQGKSNSGSTTEYKWRQKSTARVRSF